MPTTVSSSRPSLPGLAQSLGSRTPPYSFSSRALALTIRHDTHTHDTRHASELLSPFPSRIDLVSFPLERLWRSPPVVSVQEGDSFHPLVSSAQQALDRLLARGHGDRQQHQQQPSPDGLAIAKLDDLFLFKADSRQIVSDLKCLHALLLRLSAAETEATTKRARATQAATLDFAVIVFIRCTVDLIRATTCAAPSGGGGEGLRASAERWTAATMTLRKTLRTVALLHAMLGSS